MSKLTRMRPELESILLVDDEEDIVDSLSLLMEVALPGVKVLTARDGQEGLEVLKDQHVDLILSDHRMPRMDGLTMLTKARESHPDVARILLTAYHDEELARKATAQAEVDAYLKKPANKEQILGAVNSAILRAHQRRTKAQAFSRRAGLLGQGVRRL